MTDPTPHLFWITSRAAGTTALLLSSATVGFGLAMSGKLGKRGRAVDRRSFHEVLGLATMIAIAVHGMALIGDKYLHPGLLDVTVPFLSAYKTLPTSIGIVAGWGMIFLGLSFYARRRIGIARWKVIHRFTLLVWLGGLIHTLTEGTDAGSQWFILLMVAAVAPVLTLLVARAVGRRRGVPALGSAPRRPGVPAVPGAPAVPRRPAASPSR
jgi:sulfoxide reductase heme-binding subunit YedZ